LSSVGIEPGTSGVRNQHTRFFPKKKTTHLVRRPRGQRVACARLSAQPDLYTATVIRLIFPWRYAKSSIWFEQIRAKHCRRQFLSKLVGRAALTAHARTPGMRALWRVENSWLGFLSSVIGEAFVCFSAKWLYFWL